MISIFYLPDQFEDLSGDDKFQLAKQIGVTGGFYQYYFDTLPKFNTKQETFENVNELYFKIWKCYRYRNYESWRRAMSYFKKQNSKK